uniref:C2H2-type domain-containing protein n=1 Tax=Acrobeloides nanus TaxID=290746 RepID=A0A914DXH6_9BILA
MAHIKDEVMNNLLLYNDSGTSREDISNQMQAYNMSVSSLFSNTSSSSSSSVNVKKVNRNPGHDHAFKPEYENMFQGIKKSIKGDGWFYCSYCQKDLKFTSRGPYDIKTHIDRPRHIAFVQQSSNSSLNQVFQTGSFCDICNRRYKDYRSLNTHKRIEHAMGKRPSEEGLPGSRVPCEVCNRSYKDERSLRSHQRIEHGIYIEKPRKSEIEAPTSNVSNGNSGAVFSSAFG